jgi:hypothetical protein
MTNEELLREIELLKQENAQLRARTGWTPEQETYDWKQLSHIISNNNDKYEFTTKLRSRISHCMQQLNRYSFNCELVKLNRELSRIPSENKQPILNYSCYKSTLTPLEEVFDNNEDSATAFYADKITQLVELLLRHGAIATNVVLIIACVYQVYGAVLLLLHRGAPITKQCYATSPNIIELLRTKEMQKTD